MSERELKRLRACLLRQGLPPDRVRRVADEMAGHCADIEAGLLDQGVPAGRAGELALERLGRFEDLAVQMRAALAGRSFLGRHPLLGFAVLPLLSLVLLPLLPILTGNVLAFILPRLAGHGLAWDMATILDGCRTAFAVYLHVYPAGLALAFLIAARRECSGLGWAMTATAILALLTYMLTVTLTLGPPVVPGRLASGSLTLGLALSGSVAYANLWRALIPVVLFLLFFWRNVWEGHLAGRS